MITIIVLIIIIDNVMWIIFKHIKKNKKKYRKIISFFKLLINTTFKKINKK